MHKCTLTSTAERVLERLADVYALLGAAASRGARGGAGASSSSSTSASVARQFRCICRGCPAWHYVVTDSMHAIDSSE